MPRVSVLTPIYNTNPQYLCEMIESVLNQTFTDFEFLILNDSPDNIEIENIVKKYASHDKRIKYYKNENNIGITPSRNKLLELAHGEYLAIFDHDDISLPERLEKQVKYMDEHPYVGVVSGWLQCFGNRNDILKNPETDTKIKIHLTENCCISHTASMIRKKVLTDNNIKYEEYYTPAEDYRLWAQLMDVTHFYNIQQVLVKYRCYDDNTTSKQLNEMLSKHDNIQCEICDKHYAYYNFFKKQCDTNRTIFRLRLFGVIPLLKIKNNKIYLFEILPIMIIKWR